MSVLAEMFSTRQALGSVSGGRLRRLVDVKNQQAGMLTRSLNITHILQGYSYCLLTLRPALTVNATAKPSSRKRNAPHDFEDENSENIDPAILSLLSNKKFKTSNVEAKTFANDHAEANKNHYVLTNASPTPAVVERPIIIPAKLLKRKAEIPSTPVVSDRAHKSRRLQHSSAPAPAGRSPTKKRIGLLSRRRVSSASYSRVDPPSFANADSHIRSPISLNAAISSTGTISKSNLLAEDINLKSAIPVKRTWIFNVYEDTDEQYAGNMMEHSTKTLDISSEDESRIAAKNDRGKENIPPPGYVASSSNVTTSRADIMTDEPRTPLGSLNAEEFYSEDCDASSFFVVPADEEAVDVNEKVASTSGAVVGSSLYQPSIDNNAEHASGWNGFLTSTSQVKGTTNAAMENDNAVQEQPEVEIWESESVKGDNDNVTQDLARSSTSVCALQVVTDVPAIVDGANLATSI